MDPGFASWVEFGENTAVFAQDVVDIAHEVVGVTVLPVVVGTSAMIRAESLILSAVKAFSTDQALFLLHVLSDVLY